jgi:hypothetical protein
MNSRRGIVTNTRAARFRKKSAPQKPGSKVPALVFTRQTGKDLRRIDPSQFGRSSIGKRSKYLGHGKIAAVDDCAIGQLTQIRPARIESRDTGLLDNSGRV